MTKKLTGSEPGDVLDELSQREISAYETIASALENLGDSEAVIRICRRGKSGGLDFCEQIPVDPAFSPQYIKENWGGGIYSVQFYGPKPGETGNKYLKQVTLRIAGAPREKKEEQEASARGGGGLDPAVVALQMELATLKGMLAGMTQAKAGDGANPLDNLEKLTTVIRNITPPAPSGGMGAAEVFGIVRDVMSLSKEMAPDSSEGTPWGLIVEKAVEPAIGLIGQALAAQKAGPEAPPMLNPVAPAPAALEPGAPMWQAELAKIVPRLLKRAREGKDPDLAAAIFLEDAPGGVVVQLEELAKDPQFVVTTVALAEQYFPEVREVRGWVEMFLKAVQVELTEPEEAPGPVLVPEKPKKKKGDGNAVVDG